MLLKVVVVRGTQAYPPRSRKLGTPSTFTKGGYGMFMGMFWVKSRRIGVAVDSLRWLIAPWSEMLVLRFGSLASFGTSLW